MDTALFLHGEGRPAGERAASVFESLLPPSILAKATSESIIGTSAVSGSASGDSKPEASQSSSVVTPEVSEMNWDEGSSSVGTGVRTTEADSTDAQTHENEAQSSNILAEAGISPEESSRDSVRENGAGGNEEEERSGRDGIIHKEGSANAQADGRSSEQLTIAPESTEVESNENHVNGVNGVHHEVQAKSDAIDNAVLESPRDVSKSDLGPPIFTPPSEKTHGTDAAETDSSQPKHVFESQPSVLDTSVQGDDKVEKELKMMEAALLGAARQAQVSYQLNSGAFKSGFTCFLVVCNY